MADGAGNGAPIALVTDSSAGDFRPIPAGVLASNRKPKANTFDYRLNLDDATDAAGGVSLNAAAPSWPC